MDITSVIPSVTITGGSPMQSAVNLAVLGKALDVAQIQGQAMEEMIEAVPSFSEHRLDTYA